MKRKIKFEDLIALISSLLIMLSFLLISNVINKEELKAKEETLKITNQEIVYESKKIETTTNKKIVWDNLTLEELTKKLDDNLYDTLDGTGIYFAKYTEKTGLDPYLAISIVNLETGCKWGCSKLVKNCNNIGGLKGNPSCNGGSYMKYDTLEEGIEGYLNIVYNNYWLKGLTTPKLMNAKYAEDSKWAEKVNAYYEAIKTT